MKKAVLLINLGTPNSYHNKDVRRYLREFLSDPEVIDIPWIFRMLLLYGIILPFRTPKSAAAYKQIWTESGSPLMVHSQRFARKLQDELNEEFDIYLSMRYGRPGIEQNIAKITKGNHDRLIVFPLYPQYAASSTGSVITAVKKYCRKHRINIPIDWVDPFYDNGGFINSYCHSFEKATAGKSFDHVLFSFHGLPERHIRKTDKQGNYCLKDDDSCCLKITEKNNLCYRAQCFQSAYRIAERLGLAEEEFSISFQSRLNKKWIRPFTDEIIHELLSKGKKNLVVFCPSFIADCLETLEEINMRLKEDFLSGGGRTLLLIPSLNDQARWVHAAAEIIKKGTVHPRQGSHFADVLR